MRAECSSLKLLDDTVTRVAYVRTFFQRDLIECVVTRDLFT